MANKSTKREVINMMLADKAIVANSTYAEFLNHELELLDKKSSNKKPTKTQTENEVYKTIIIDVMETSEFNGSCSDLIKTRPEFAEFSTSKMSALLKQLVAEGKVVRDTSSKVTMFRLV